jgi:hypothetical protein
MRTVPFLTRTSLISVQGSLGVRQLRGSDVLGRVRTERHAHQPVIRRERVLTLV